MANLSLIWLFVFVVFVLFCSVSFVVFFSSMGLFGKCSLADINHPACVVEFLGSFS